MYHWRFDGYIFESMNFVYATDADAGLSVYSECVLWELSKPLFFVTPSLRVPN